MRWRQWAGALSLAAMIAARAEGSAPRASVSSLAPAEMLDFAERADQAGRGKLAERILRTLATDPSLAVRSEARFRLARLTARQGKLLQAAVLLRSILDDLPTAQPVRLELARIQEKMGDEAGARRSLRQVRAGPLPPDVARFVDRWSGALRARQPFGSSIEFAVAPDSNINHATATPYLTTVLGDFALDRAARRRSGVGLAMRGELYARTSPNRRVALIARLKTSTDRYRQHRFDRTDMTVSAGPEIRLGTARATLEASRGWYRSGGKLYADSVGGSLYLSRPLGRQSQLEIGTSVQRVRHALNPLESGTSTALSLSYERALSVRAGMVLGAVVQRRHARDPGYSARSAGLSLTAYREVGAATLIGALRVGRLTADEALFLYPDPRRDRSFGASVGVQLRKVEWAGFAPFVRLNWDRNASNIAVYDTRGLRTEFGLTRAF